MELFTFEKFKDYNCSIFYIERMSDSGLLKPIAHVLIDVCCLFLFLDFQKVVFIICFNFFNFYLALGEGNVKCPVSKPLPYIPMRKTKLF